MCVGYSVVSFNLHLSFEVAQEFLYVSTGACMYACVCVCVRVHATKIAWVAFPF